MLPFTQDVTDFTAFLLPFTANNVNNKYHSRLRFQTRHLKITSWGKKCWMRSLKLAHLMSLTRNIWGTIYHVQVRALMMHQSSCTPQHREMTAVIIAFRF